MDTIANLWWLWLLGFIICAAYAGFNQVRRMKGMFQGAKDGDIENAGDSFFNGLGGFVGAGIGGSIFGILLAIAVVVQLAARFGH